MDFFSLFRRPTLDVPSAGPVHIGSHPGLTAEGYWRTHSHKPRLVIFTGAGLSQESGLGTFRGQDGHWENHRVEEICNGRQWREHRDKVNAFYDDRRRANQAARPHDGHHWCAEQEAAGAVLVTQNVDTLLEKAGAQHVLHLHGRVDQHQCFGCSFRWQWGLFPQRDCPTCQSQDTRANVVFFHEPVPAYPAASRTVGGLGVKDVLLVVGTSGQVVNPLRWLAGPAQVWVADPEPATALTQREGVRAFGVPASQLRATVGAAWNEHCLAAR